MKKALFLHMIPGSLIFNSLIFSLSLSFHILSWVPRSSVTLLVFSLEKFLTRSQNSLDSFTIFHMLQVTVSPNFLPLHNHGFFNFSLQ